MRFAVARAIGRNDFATAITLMRADLSGMPSDTPELAFISQCHWWLGEVTEAIEVAREALNLEPDCFEAHRILASLYCSRQEHRLGSLHARNALRTWGAPAQIPRWIYKLGEAIAWLRGGFAAAADQRLSSASHATEQQQWLEWCREYLHWNDQRGTLTPSNEAFRPAPNPRR